VLAILPGFGENFSMADGAVETEQAEVDDRLFAVAMGPPQKSATPSSVTPKTFRHYDQSQSFLIPPSLDDWLLANHEARFISDAVEDLLDLSPIYAAYTTADGAPPYAPQMMLKLLLYGYSTGVTSSREIERRCVVDVAFRWLAANATPDYRSIARFRRRHLGVLDELFTQVLRLCAGAGLVSLGRVALDGTKLRASASRHKAMSYDHLVKKTEQLKAEVAAILAEAEAIDQAEDEAFGADRRGDEIDPELSRRETRLAKMRVAMDAIETEAREKAAAKAAEQVEAKGGSRDEIAEATKRAVEAATPSPKAQRNFTDPDARIMKTADGSFHYTFNGQAVVDEAHQVVLSGALTQEATDVKQLIPMIEATDTDLTAAGIDGSPRVLLADAGYCSADNLEALVATGLDALVATGRLSHDEQVPPRPRGRIPKNATAKQRMARRLRTKSGKADYARRKVIVEPAFGQMKTRQHAGQLRLRGLAGAQGEWTLHLVCHNLRKLANAAGSAAITPA
jgi:transposase